MDEVTEGTQDEVLDQPAGTEDASHEGSSVEKGESFTDIDPNEAPEGDITSEWLQERYKQMQADYTRKTQQIAQLRQQYEPLVQLGNPEELQEAIELRSMLQDPRNWVELHRDLTSQLRDMGYTPQEAHEAATDALNNEAKPQTPPLDLSILDNDPELAPLKQYVEGLRTDVESVKGEFNEWRQAQEAQAMEMAIVGEIQRSVNAIRQSRPDYSDGDIDAIFELASYHDGDMFAAQKRYDQIFADRMNRWMASKQSPSSMSPLPGAATVTQKDDAPKSWEEARARALEFAAELDSQ